MNNMKKVIAIFNTLLLILCFTACGGDASVTEKNEESIIGFESKDIVDNMADESTTYLLFVKDNAVVAKICGSTDSLGYTFDFGCYEKCLRIDNSQEATFLVTEERGAKLLEYEQKK